MLPEKVCTKCNALKLLSEFSVDNRNASGKAAWCRLCTNAWKKTHRRVDADPGHKVPLFNTEGPALPFVAIRAILEYKHGWRMSHQRVQQILERAEEKIRVRLEGLNDVQLGAMVARGDDVDNHMST